MDNDTANQIKSVYAYDDFASVFAESAENCTLIITDKNKADDMLAPHRNPTFPAVKNHQPCKRQYIIK